MGAGSSKELTPEAKALQAEVNHRAMEKAIAKGDLAPMFYPLLYGADPNRRNEKNELLLEQAIKGKHTLNVAYLLCFKASREELASTGQTLSQLARQVHKECAGDEDLEMRSKAIYELVEQPGTENLIRAAYDKKLTRDLEQERRDKDRKFAGYFLSIVLFLHLFALFFPESETSALMELSPILKIMRLGAFHVKRRVAMLTGGKDEL